jgi:hemolysin activation/secretion protein
VGEAFGSTHAVARAWVPLGRPFVALRAGGQMLWGGFPVHESAFLGGRTSLRGYETDRFAGDASLFGSTELHLPITTLTLLVRGELGVFGLADAGRVFVDGESPGGWHTSIGGGTWFSTLGHTLSLAYAKGETGRLYLRLGMPL